MKKIISVLFCLMLVFGMIASCDNGNPLKATDIAKLKGVEAEVYGKGYDDVPGKPAGVPSAPVDDTIDCSCGETLTTVNEVEQHIYKGHSFPCPICGKTVNMASVMSGLHTMCIYELGWGVEEGCEYCYDCDNDCVYCSEAICSMDCACPGN